MSLLRGQPTIEMSLADALRVMKANIPDMGDMQVTELAGFLPACFLFFEIQFHHI